MMANRIHPKDNYEARKSGFAPLKKIKAWVFYLIPQKHGGGGVV